MQHSKNKEIENLVSELKKYSKVVAVILFGSYARKRIKPLSDIDIAVIIKDMDKKLKQKWLPIHLKISMLCLSIGYLCTSNLKF